MNQMRGIIRSYSYEYTGVQPRQQPDNEDSESTDDEIEYD